MKTATAATIILTLTATIIAGTVTPSRPVEIKTTTTEETR